MQGACRPCAIPDYLRQTFSQNDRCSVCMGCQSQWGWAWWNCDFWCRRHTFGTLQARYHRQRKHSYSTFPLYNQEYFQCILTRWCPNTNMVNACGSYLSFKDFSGGPFRMYEEVCERLKNLSSPILLTIGDIIHLRVPSVLLSCFTCWQNRNGLVWWYNFDIFPRSESGFGFIQKVCGHLRLRFT